MNLDDIFFGAGRDEPILTAADDMRRQLELDTADGNKGSHFSLDSMWRAAGRPEGRDPASWCALAAPLIAGVMRYLDNLNRAAEGKTIDKLDIDAFWQSLPMENVYTLEDGDHFDYRLGWQAGDTIAVYLIAACYARHLDNLATQERDRVAS